MILSHKRTFTILLVLFCLNPAQSAFELAEDNLIAQSLSGAGCADVFLNGQNKINPASPIYQSVFAISYCNLYNLSELQQSTLSFQFHGHKQGISFKIFDFGNKLYRENAFTLNMGREISEQFFLGIQLEYYYLYIQNLGSDGTFGIGWGGIYQPFHNLSCGILMRNVNRAKIGACQENLPVIIQGGLAYRVEPDFILIFDIFKDKLFPAEPRLGMEYSHFKNFVIRLGVAQQPISLSAGFDIKVNRIVLSYAFNTHNQLGFTHTFQLSFNFGENRLIE